MTVEEVTTPTDNQRKLIPVTKWNEAHDYPPLGQLRALVYNAEDNGFDKCIRRIGKRVLIDEARYFEWVDEQNAQATSHS